MKVGVLFSGGKDSALAALLLAPHYEVELNTFSFDQNRDLGAVEAAAAVLGLPWWHRMLPDGLLETALDRLVADGYPGGAINLVHRAALKALAGSYRVVADGTRFDDRVPMLDPGEARSLMDRFGCSYLRPLLGFPRAEVDRLADRHLVVERGETGRMPNGDYEDELRAGLRRRGIDPAPLFPPVHEQTLVRGRMG
ncbi:MAG TPA: asparagine synthase-related protein [Methanoregulaceae archaeon]|nr:asparagine synthase-related protein [Methanoregulaceae archaeon]HQJ87250.1 asparagine synthase-related protein [Methanoregulaceae archaeon]